MKLTRLGKDVLFSLLFPYYCPECGEEWEDNTGWLCPECWKRLPRAGRSLWWRNTALRNRVTVIYSYSGIMRDVVHQMKYNGRDDIAVNFGKRAAERIRHLAYFKEIKAVVPVPLHPVRVRERGFDQSLTMAESVAENLGIPLRADLITRTRNTTPQSHLSDSERLKNLQGAFASRKQQKPVPEGDVLLVDDVIHTGATAYGCIVALNSAGISRVRVLSACG